jgi:hypothetical protein
MTAYSIFDGIILSAYRGEQPHDGEWIGSKASSAPCGLLQM